MIPTKTISVVELLDWVEESPALSFSRMSTHGNERKRTIADAPLAYAVSGTDPACAGEVVLTESRTCQNRTTRCAVDFDNLRYSPQAMLSSSGEICFDVGRLFRIACVVAHSKPAALQGIKMASLLGECSKRSTISICSPHNKESAATNSSYLSSRKKERIAS
jgi:hypothetical protein